MLFNTESCIQTPLACHTRIAHVSYAMVMSTIRSTRLFIIIYTTKIPRIAASPELLNQVDSDVDQVTGDGAYDTHEAYLASIHIGAKPCFPPRVNASRRQATDEARRLRNHAVSQIGYPGMKHWKNKHHYHRRNCVETAMFRFKHLLGNRLQARTMARQSREISIKCIIMNKMTPLGMPISEPC